MSTRGRTEISFQCSCPSPGHRSTCVWQSLVDVARDGLIWYICKAWRSPLSTARGITKHSCVGAKGSLCLITNRPSRARVTCCKYLFKSFALVTFFEGRVPWVKCACTQRKFGHSAWVAFPALRLVKGRRTLPDAISLMVTLCTAALSIWETKEHTWHLGSSQGGALRLAKSAGVLADPDKCWTRTWYLLTVDR